jgi:hypothetical protein
MRRFPLLRTTRTAQLLGQAGLADDQGGSGKQPVVREVAGRQRCRRNNVVHVRDQAIAGQQVDIALSGLGRVVGEVVDLVPRAREPFSRLPGAGDGGVTPIDDTVEVKHNRPDVISVCSHSMWGQARPRAGALMGKQERPPTLRRAAIAGPAMLAR